MHLPREEQHVPVYRARARYDGAVKKGEDLCVRKLTTAAFGPCVWSPDWCRLLKCYCTLCKQSWPVNCKGPYGYDERYGAIKLSSIVGSLLDAAGIQIWFPAKFQWSLLQPVVSRLWQKLLQNQNVQRVIWLSITRHVICPMGNDLPRADSPAALRSLTGSGSTLTATAGQPFRVL